MYPTYYYALIFGFLTIAHGFMVELVDGSFVPLLPRAPGGGLPVRLVNVNDSSYLATVQMGTPPQQVQMSASLSQNFISIASPPTGVNDSTYYQPAISSSYVPSDVLGTVQTSAGENVTGHFVGEICALKAATSALNFTYHASLLVTDPSVTNALFPLLARGLLGYGVNAPSTAPANASLIPSFLPANFTNAVCGIELNHADDPIPDGVFTMGAVDPSAFTGDFTDLLVPPNSSTSWSIPFQEIRYLVSGRPQSQQGLLASIDLYYTSIKVTTQMARLIYAGVAGSHPVSDTVWSLPCGSSFPITLTFGGTPFVINERDTIVKLSNGTCLGAVTGGAQDMAQIGAPFMRNVYTRFGANKYSNGTVSFFVGFAQKVVRQNPSATTSSSSSGNPTSTIPSTASTTTTTGATPSAAGAPPIIGQGVGLFSTLAIASVLTISFL